MICMVSQEVYEIISQTAKSKIETLDNVTGGLSDAIKYKAKINGDFWMVKIFDGTPLRLAWYKELSKLSGGALAVPEMCQLFNENKLCLITPWIEGESLEKKLVTATKSEIANYGVQAADILNTLHSVLISDNSYIERLINRVNNVCKTVEEMNLTFPKRDDCCQFIKNSIKEYAAEDICLVHRDIRPENFIVNNGKLFLFDFDNGGIGEAASDFAYLTTMGAKEHLVFSKEVLSNYLSDNNKQVFWDKNLFYSTLQVMEYAIWKWQIKGKQVYFQADNLIKQYNDFKSNIPAWWKVI